ncbi:uncharacterized protein PGTG_12456 [Puccinia graminis f. sp. tritici CRL 75-36-700-3]|uniref:Uncharacterized protein n=1 Tax=Puccinia graminis f. sp. tritici (strain CRL 75-36-700-3 / race SCCL) TaxID=418459 RepID=E3KQC5_PUCGT|nr:uncharacterized protein PGTG_12456 [Puccinia graminis f. sp. tritici CRL 75-36-700-3]EFP86500.2 hypothetical protein PGTG_12456 [Puccinia graminis f. sp. tritici CRL 75-36-700-3]
MDQLRNGQSIRLTRSAVARGRSWYLDAVNGGPTSMDILVTWLSTPGNYDRWLSTPIPGPHREDFCTEIVEIMQQHGIHHRNAMGINNRILVIRRSYNSARDFFNHATRAGEEVDPIVLVYVRRVCQHWDLLDPVMGPQDVDIQPGDHTRRPSGGISSDDESTNTNST